ncbi:MAG: hypothetical protein AAF242_14170, partial [Bacteroidota bacterium]
MDINCPTDNNGMVGPDEDNVAIWNEPVSTLNSFPNWSCGTLGSVSAIATDEEPGIGVEAIYVGAYGVNFFQGAGAQFTN